MKVKSEVYFDKVDVLEFGTWLENIKKKTVEYLKCVPQDELKS